MFLEVALFKLFVRLLRLVPRFGPVYRERGQAYPIDVPWGSSVL